MHRKKMITECRYDVHHDFKLSPWEEESDLVHDFLHLPVINNPTAIKNPIKQTSPRTNSHAKPRYRQKTIEYPSEKISTARDRQSSQPKEAEFSCPTYRPKQTREDISASIKFALQQFRESEVIRGLQRDTQILPASPLFQKRKKRCSVNQKLQRLRPHLSREYPSSRLS